MFPFFMQIFTAECTWEVPSSPLFQPSNIHPQTLILIEGHLCSFTLRKNMPLYFVCITKPLKFGDDITCIHFIYIKNSGWYYRSWYIYSQCFQNARGVFFYITPKKFLEDKQGIKLRGLSTSFKCKCWQNCKYMHNRQ